MTDIGTIITVIACFAALLGVMIGLFIYLANKIDNLQVMVSQEMKDFHGRLCKIEEKNTLIIQRIWENK